MPSTTSSPDPRRWRPLWGLVVAPAVVAVLVGLAYAIQQKPTMTGVIPLIALVITAACIALCIAVRARVPLWANGAALICAVAITGALYATSPSAIGFSILTTTSLVSAAWAVGSGIGRRVQHASHMLPAACVAAAADLASVLHPSGPSNALASSERALAVLALQVPLPGAQVAPVLGVGDLVFAALAFAVAAQHGVRWIGPLIGVVAGAGASIALSGWLEKPIPALVAMGALVVALTPEFRRVRRADRTATSVAIAIAIAVGIAMVARALIA